MIDELDLAFGESDRDIKRHRRSKKGKGGVKSTFAFLMVFILLAVLGGGVYLGYDRVKDFFTAADYDGAGGAAVQVQIKENATITEMGDTLVDKDVVKSTKAFIQAAEKNPLGKNIQSGTFNLKKQMSAKAAVTALLDPKSRVAKGITITEGMTSFDVYATLAKSTGVKLADFKAAGKDPSALGVPDLWFKRADGQKVTKSIEGFLFPDTYEFQPGDTADEMLSAMVARFVAEAEKLDFPAKVEQNRKISPYEALIVASLAEAEAGNPDDLGKVARVAYNRLYSGDFPCNCLQFDVGINYYYQLQGKPKKPSKEMTTEELQDPKNPYRTDGKPGLTPTPIDNPGAGAMKAAMDPPKGDWLYFVATDRKGHSAFATTLDEHNANIATAKKNGVL